MKKSSIILVFLISTLNIYSQDTLFFNNGTSKIVSLKQIQKYELQYKLFNYEDGPLFTQKISEINRISYKNGYVEVINHKEIDSLLLADLENLNKPIKDIDYSYLTYNQIVNIANEDATNNYRPRGIGTGIFFFTLITTPLGGALVSIQSNATTPNPVNLNMPNKDIVLSPIYQNAYKKKVHQIRSEKIVLNYVTAAVINVIFGVLYISSQRKEEQ
ncbi:MAG: hypothetical protein Q8K70_00415 [Bacteroidota bacterium]|nr:hypothetical protein [Bacteroidota bacterium]